MKTAAPTQPDEPIIYCPFEVSEGEIKGCGLRTEDVDGGEIKFRWLPPDDDGGTEIKGYQVMYAAYNAFTKTTGTWHIPGVWPPIDERSRCKDSNRCVQDDEVAAQKNVDGTKYNNIPDTIDGVTNQLDENRYGVYRLQRLLAVQWYEVRVRAITKGNEC